MQVACIEAVPRYNIENVVSSINKLSDVFRQRNWPVIHIQHEEPTGDFLRGSPSWAISPMINVAEPEPVVSKSYCDAFIKTELLSMLTKQGVTELTITGCATDFCVDSTIKGAIAAGFNVVIPEDAHTTADRPHVSAQDLINHFNWNWANLIVGEQTIKVLPSRELI